MLIQAGTTVCFMLSDVTTVWVWGHIFDHDLPLVRTSAMRWKRPIGPPTAAFAAW
jgi:hypothetical protein